MSNWRFIMTALLNAFSAGFGGDHLLEGTAHYPAMIGLFVGLNSAVAIWSALKAVEA